MKKLNKKTFLFAGLFATGAISATAIACAPNTNIDLKEQRTLVLNKIVETLSKLELNSKNTYETIDKLNEDAKKATASISVAALLDSDSSQKFIETLGKAVIIKNEGSTIEESKIILNLLLTYEGDDVSANLKLNITYIAPSTNKDEPSPEVPNLTEEQLKAVEWYKSLSETNIVSESESNLLPSEVNTIDLGFFKTPLTQLPEGFELSLTKVNNSINDSTGELKVKVVLFKAPSFYNVDGQIKSDLESATGKVVSLNGFKTSVVVDREKVIAFYGIISDSIALENEEFKKLKASEFKQENLDTLKSKFSNVPESYQLQLELMNETVDDKTGELSFKVLLVKDGKFLNIEGDTLETMTDAGKSVKLTGFTVSSDESKPIEDPGTSVPVDPTPEPGTPVTPDPENPEIKDPLTPIVDNSTIVRTWFNSLLESYSAAANTEIFPTSLTVDNVNTLLSSIIKSPLANATVEFKIVSTDDLNGLAKILVILKTSDKFYTVEGNEFSSEIGKEITVNNLNSLRTLARSLYLAQNSLITLKSELTAEQAIAQFDTVTADLFTDLKAKLTHGLKLEVRKTVSGNQVNAETGFIYANIYLKRNDNEFFRLDGTVVDSLDKVDGKEIRIGGFEIKIPIQELAREINAWKVKDNLTSIEAWKLQELLKPDLSFEKVIELLKMSASEETPLASSMQNLEFVSTKKLLTWNINDQDVSLTFKATLKDKTGRSANKDVSFKTDFAGFLPAFLTIDGKIKEDVNDNYLVVIFKELSEGNTYENWSRFIKTFVKNSKNSPKKLDNFANAFALMVDKKTPKSIRNYGLIYPYNKADWNSISNPINEMVVMSNGKTRNNWIGANKDTLVIGGLQNYAKDSNEFARGEAWTFNPIDGTRNSTFMTYNGIRWVITDEKGFFVESTRKTVKDKNTKTITIPFNNGVAVGLRLLLQELI
ncbi:lipoprotein 17-related variable surface protein [Mycoplasmopsis agassizii]|uniref:lipoprotein 17-related variable surface protein n=1 Tax=Mycoplasmopsis agassizii TaxID=33922 RepID=UPI003528EF98